MYIVSVFYFAAMCSVNEYIKQELMLYFHI